MITTIFLPVSRSDHLDLIFTLLELLECKKENTNLFVMVDGDTDLYTATRNYVNNSKFAQKLCVEYKGKGLVSNHNINHRRHRIADIHNEAKKYMWESDFVFGIEDDTTFKANALKKLHKEFALRPNAGMIEGVELGRWQEPYVGAWRADDVYEPSIITSAKPSAGVDEIDAGGFYCYLTRFDNFMKHEYRPFGTNTLGPDVNYGLWLRQQGHMNYIDWDVRCNHHTKDGIISLENSVPVHMKLHLKSKVWERL